MSSSEEDNYDGEPMEGDEDNSKVVEEEIVEGNSEEEQSPSEASESDSEDDRRRPRRKKPRTDASRFLNLEAEVESDEDEEDEYDQDDAELSDEEAEKMTRSYASEVSRHRQRSVLDTIQEADERTVVQALKQRHRNYGSSRYDGVADIEDRTEISQQSYLPSVKDPKLWLVRCKQGKEREAVICLMQKFLDMEEIPEKKLLIKSAVCCDNLKGFIYVEADKEAHVKNAVAGLRIIFDGKIKLVPISEMTTVLTVIKKAEQIEPGSWVRVKRGTYRGDIAQVFELTKSKATVRLIPRLDLNKWKNNTSNLEDNVTITEDGKRKRKQRPVARFFNPDEIVQMGGGGALEARTDKESQTKYYVYEGNKYVDGYLQKTVNIRTLETQNVKPSLDEVQKFNMAVEGSDGSQLSAMEAALATVKSSKAVNLSKGDTVKVIDGELKQLLGVVESVIDEDTIYVMPKHDDLKALLTFRSDQLIKYFEVGAHVKVIAGRFEGETGLILRLDDKVVTLFSDLNMKELQVLISDIQECAEVATGAVQLGQYELHDMVQLDAQRVGVIVKVERQSFKILDNNGSVQTVRLQEVGNKRQNRRAVAFDKNHNQIGVGDVLQVVDGPQKGKQGTVKHIYRYYAFLQASDVLENSGIFVVRTANTSSLAGRNKGPAAPRNSAASSFGNRRDVPGSPGGRGFGRGGGGGFNSFGGGGGRGRGRGREDNIIRKTIKVTKGPWKGYVGIVVDATDTTARIELHTKCKIVNVPREFVEAKDDLQRGPLDANNNSNLDRASSVGSWSIRQTPLREAPGTPLRMGTPRTHTPLHTAWDPQQPNTPMRSNNWDDLSPASDTPNSAHDYALVTPGYQPYGPFSPGLGYDSERNTPQDANMYNPSTPTGMNPSTPAALDYSDQNTPRDSSPYGATPGGGYPATPATPGLPQTPGISESGVSYDNEDDSVGSSVSGSIKDHGEAWATPDIEVRIVGEAYRGGQLQNATGVVKEVLGDSTCKVALFGKERDRVDVLAVPVEFLELVRPSKTDRIKVIHGEHKGSTGELFGIDGADGIVQMDQLYGRDIKILNLGWLAKYWPS